MTFRLCTLFLKLGSHYQRVSLSFIENPLIPPFTLKGTREKGEEMKENNIDTSWLFGYIAIYDKREIKMKNMVKPQHEARAKIIKAMAHPSRLFIIEELSKHERCVGELTDMIGADA
jgi:hypothetical protein